MLQSRELFLGRFEIDRLAGRGGMGAVYRARDTRSGEAVALKLLEAREPRSAERFTREAALLARLDHPGIVRYLSHGEAEAGQLYLAMEWLDGEDLERRLARGALSIEEALR